MKEKKVVVDNSYNIKEIEVDDTWARDLLTEDYRQYRDRWDLATQHRRVFDFPLFLEVETSYACNYRCPKCPRQAIGHTKKDGFLKVELLDKLFKEVRRYNMPSITFSHGGEPLMRKDLPDLIAKARESNILDRMFHTNGFLLDRKLSADLIKSGLTKINFSLDAASPEVYDKVRPGGDYGKVVANIMEFLEVKKRTGKSYPRIRVSFVISDENKHEQKKFYELWKDKVNLIAFQQCYDFSEMRTDSAYNPENYGVSTYCCSQLFQLLTVTYEGDILMCEHDYGHDHVLGNLKTDTLYECWNSRDMKRFRETHINNRWADIPMCKKCINCLEKYGKHELS